jgi:hypothetical protein
MKVGKPRKVIRAVRALDCMYLLRGSLLMR